MSNWSIPFNNNNAQQPQPTTPDTPQSEAVAAELRGLMIGAGLADFAREHGLAPKAALATLADFITEDPAMLQMKREVVYMADLNEPVVIFGESGTGKETIARALHGDRLGKFVAINCAAMPETLLESELFGHRAGAFTDAKQDKVGLFEVAQNGTLFLDEIGEMPMLLQAKLLRAIQESSIRRVGDTIERKINCRIVSATNRPLYMFETQQDVRELHATFRLDLYWRLAVYQVRISPLRDRRDDILELLDAKYDKAGTLSNDEREMLHQASLLGNCRELEAHVKRINMRKMLAVQKQ